MTDYRLMNMSQITSRLARSRSMRCGYWELTACQPHHFMKYTELPCWPRCFIATRHGPDSTALLPSENRLVHQPYSKRCGYCADDVLPLKELFADSDILLFKRVLSNANHSLHKLLAPLNNTHTYNQRKRPHNHQLPMKGNLLQQSNFIIRALYAESY